MSARAPDAVECGALVGCVFGRFLYCVQPARHACPHGTEYGALEPKGHLEPSLDGPDDAKHQHGPREP